MYLLKEPVLLPASMTCKTLAGLLLCFAMVAEAPIVQGQSTKIGPDEIVFTNGDQLTGKLVGGSGSSIVFKGDSTGLITVTLDKVKLLRSSDSFAVLTKGSPITSLSAARAVVPGTLSFSDGRLVIVHPSGSPDSIPANQISFIMDQATYAKDISGKTGFLHGWNGAINGGATVVRSTNYGETLTAGISLVRATPGVPFLPARNRTSFDLQETYGKLTAPVVPQTTPASAAAVTETSIFHADAERDEFFSSRFFALAQTAFDHNYSQGLTLQQIYGGGIGYTPLKDTKQELDVKATIQYEKQVFTSPSSNDNLIGSTISEMYHRTLPHSVSFSETGNLIPSFNIPSAYSANVSGNITLPVYKRLGCAFTATDNYLNNPANGYNKNSFQFVAGVTYTLK